MGTPEALVSLDFETRFPHRFWISNWGTDDDHPNGFRYKLLSMRPEPEGLIEFVVVLEERGGNKIELERLDISPSAFERTASIFVEGLSEEYGVSFELLDTSKCRTAAQFDRVVTSAGWHEWRN